MNRKANNPAPAGYEPLKEFLAKCGFFTPHEIEILAVAAKNHSSKKEVGSPLEEIVKDADVLDCYQYNMPIEREEQKKRLENILQETIRSSKN